jgi:hypothetical protein
MNHIHKYKRKNIGRSKVHSFYVYQCQLNCNHYIREDLLFGRSSICWDCDKEFILQPRGSRPFKLKPICDSCWNIKWGHKEKKEIKEKDIEKILKTAGVI